jgi:heme/copper-type cytochrome/quinol oxidase subunit 2
VASEFLPPDAAAEPPPPTRPEAGRADFLPPEGARAGAGPPATAALAWGAAGLAVLAVTWGGFFFLALPASITGLVLGRRAQRRRPPAAHADVAVLIAIVGIVLAIVAAAAWIVVTALHGTAPEHSPGDPDLEFQVIRMLTPR